MKLIAEWWCTECGTCGDKLAPVVELGGKLGESSYICGDCLQKAVFLLNPPSSGWITGSIEDVVNISAIDPIRFGGDVVTIAGPA